MAILDECGYVFSFPSQEYPCSSQNSLAGAAGESSKNGRQQTNMSKCLTQTPGSSVVVVFPFAVTLVQDSFDSEWFLILHEKSRSCSSYAWMRLSLLSTLCLHDLFLFVEVSPMQQSLFFTTYSCFLGAAPDFVSNIVQFPHCYSCCLHNVQSTVGAHIRKLGRSDCDQFWVLAGQFPAMVLFSHVRKCLSALRQYRTLNWFLQIPQTKDNLTPCQTAQRFRVTTFNTHMNSSVSSDWVAIVHSPMLFFTGFASVLGPTRFFLHLHPLSDLWCEHSGGCQQLHVDSLCHCPFWK